MPKPKTPIKVKEGQKTLYRYTPAMFSPVAQGTKRFDSNYYVEGYASTFDAPYELGRDFDNQPYYEVVSSRSLDGANMSDVIMQFDHSGMVAARQRNDTLLVEPDTHGLFIAADLSKSEFSRNLYESISNGLVDRMSWAFTPDYDSMDFDEATRTQTINKVFRVYDVSAVSLPADEDTEISARAALDGVIERRRLEQAERKRLETRRHRVALLASMSD
jgi:HK97 family phage prohead protease